MHRLLVAVALLPVGGCIGENVPDYRPLELNYLTTSIFGPSCGLTQCHSTFKQQSNLVFDTPEGTRKSLLDDALIRFNSLQYDADNPTNADLIHWITDIDPFGAGKGRMPQDAPIPNRDVELLIEWIGASAPGAQCDPMASVPPGTACARDNSGRDVVVTCTSDWNFDMSTAIPCLNGCVNGVCMP